MNAKAIEHYKQSLAIKPDYNEVYFNLAKLYKKIGKYDLAVQNYNKLLQINPDDAYVLTELGVSLREQDEIEQAQ